MLFIDIYRFINRHQFIVSYQFSLLKYSPTTHPHNGPLIHSEFPPLTWQTLVTILSGSIVNTLQTVSSRPVTVAHSIRVHISIAIASLAQFNGSLDSCWITIEAIRAGLTPLTKVTQRTLQANDRVISHCHTGTVVRARTPLTIVGSATERISIVSPRALVTGVSCRVVLTDTTSRLRVTDIRVLVTVTGHTRHKGTTVRGTVTESWSTRLTELANVSFRATALLHPTGSRSSGTTLCCLQLHIIQVGFSDLRIRRTDLHRRQVTQDGHESTGSLTRLPGVVRMFMQTEGVLTTLLVWNWVTLGEDWQGDGSTSTLQDNIRGRRIRSRLSNKLQTEL